MGRKRKKWGKKKEEMGEEKGRNGGRKRKKWGKKKEERGKKKEERGKKTKIKRCFFKMQIRKEFRQKGCRKPTCHKRGKSIIFGRRKINIIFGPKYRSLYETENKKLRY
jgi:hypothetical protein